MESRAWEYHTFSVERIPKEWHGLSEESRTWPRFRSMLLPWEDVVDRMNQVGQQGWEIFHVREEFQTDWAKVSVAVEGHAAATPTRKDFMGALAELGAEPMRDFDLSLSSRKTPVNPRRIVKRIHFYARRPVADPDP